jgi:uncharacterized membrane protein
MGGLSPLGLFHTAIALVALVFGAFALIRDKEIRLDNRVGQAYLGTTLVAALTALGIFRHGSFGPPHVLAVLTLVALVLGTLAGATTLFGARSRAVRIVSYTFTLLLGHLIPGFAETLTRVPAAAPFASSPDDPVLRPILGGLVALFAVVVFLQLRRSDS